jgi:hypothetical protein
VEEPDLGVFEAFDAAVDGEDRTWGCGCFGGVG